MWHESPFTTDISVLSPVSRGAAAPFLVRCRSTCVHHFTNKLWIPPLLLLYNQFACVTGFVLTWMFCVKSSMISKCSYCLHNLSNLLVKQENIILWSEARKPLHRGLLKGHAIQRWKQPSYISLSSAQEVRYWARWTLDLNSRGCHLETGFVFYHTVTQKTVTG